MLSGVFFVALNLVDAFLTKQAFTLGEAELNPVVRYFDFGDNLVIKGLLALAIALVLCHFGRSHLLWYLNLAMITVVFWNMAVLIVLQIYC